MVRCHVLPGVFFFRASFGAIQLMAVGEGLGLSQISEIHHRFLLHLISYMGASRVANEDNVQYWKEDWLQPAYRDRRMRSGLLGLIIITPGFDWRTVQARLCRGQTVDDLRSVFFVHNNTCRYQ